MGIEHGYRSEVFGIAGQFDVLDRADNIAAYLGRPRHATERVDRRIVDRHHFATGFPRLVMMMIGARFCATSSIRRRQSALKLAAETRGSFLSVVDNHGHVHLVI
jgi:hypothetical protein